MRIRRFLKGVLIAFLAILVVGGLLWLCYGKIIHHQFQKVAERDVKIPGLSSGFIPQGVTRIEGKDVTLVCGYYTTKKASSIFVLSGEEKKEIPLATEEGKTFTGHSGGLTAVGDYVYVSNASKLFVLPLSSLLEAEDGEALAFADHLDVPCRASYCSSSDGMLFVGEFHEVGYTTEESHRLKTRDGKTYQAMTFGYAVDEKGRIAETPSVVFATPDKVQGFAKVGDTIALSCSYGRFNPSHLYLFDGKGSDGTFSYGEGELPLLILDGERAKATLKMPHMSEDIESRDGWLFVAFEACSKKYGGGVIPASIGNIMKLDLSSL